MPKKKSKHPKRKRKSHHRALHAFEHEPHGHHARLRKHHHASGSHATSHTSPHHSPARKKAHKRPLKARKKAHKRPPKARKRSALMDRLHAAAAGAREQLKNLGRRHKHHQPEKPVTEQTLRDQSALKRLRRCSY